jgi:hypothetical protein
MSYASRDKKPLKDIAIIDQESIDLIVSSLPPTEVTLTPEQIASIASKIDISGKVDKVTGKSLVADTEIGKIHSLRSDDQDISNFVVKETGKGLSTNDYTAGDKDKLTAVPIIKVSATAPQNPQVNDIWIDIS